MVGFWFVSHYLTTETLCTSKTGLDCPTSCWTRAFSMNTSTWFPMVILGASQWCTKHLNLFQKRLKIEPCMPWYSWKVKVPIVSQKKKKGKICSWKLTWKLWPALFSLGFACPHRTTDGSYPSSHPFCCPIINWLLCCSGVFSSHVPIPKLNGRFIK